MMDLIITKTVTHDSLPGVSVTVRPATYRQGLLRTILMDRERAASLGRDVSEPSALAGAVGANIIYPSLVAATVEHEGFETWPPTSAEVMDLPEGFVTEWEKAVFALNPQWKAVAADEEKKA